MVSPSMLIVTSKVIKIIVSTSTHFGDKKSKSLKYLEESVLVYTELSWKDLFDLRVFWQIWMRKGIRYILTLTLESFPDNKFIVSLAWATKAASNISSGWQIYIAILLIQAVPTFKLRMISFDFIVS